MRRLLILTILLIVYGSLYPWHFDFAGGRNPIIVLLDSWPAVWDRFALRDGIVNVVLYMPLGTAAMCVLARRFPGGLAFAPVIIGGAALSVAMELTQVYIPLRVCSLFDVVSNTAGTAIGAALAVGFGLTRPREARGGRWRLGEWLLLIAFAGYQLYPFFPVVSTTRLGQALAQLAAADGFVWHEVWCCGAEWFAAMLLVEAVGESLWAPVIVGALAARTVVVTRTVALHEVLGAVLAAIAWMAVRRGHARLRVGVWWMASALALRELAPFHFTASANPFTWIPFVPTFDSERQSALVILFRKAFDYAAMVWLLRERGVSYLRAGVGLALALAVLEAVQRYLPGRTPETTDAVLASLMTLILWTLHNFERQRGLA